MNCLYCNTEYIEICGFVIRCPKCPHNVIFVPNQQDPFTAFDLYIDKYRYYIRYHITTKHLYVEQHARVYKLTGINKKIWVFECCDIDKITPYNIESKIKTIIVYQ